MPELSDLEFHLRGIGLAPCGRGQEGAAVYVEEVPGLSTPVRSCPCGDQRRTTCQHLHDVSRAVLAFRERYGGRSWTEVFEATPWARVHRIGQHRAVQVFKLVTEGTLEEKIHAMIERKRAMMNEVVQEDDHRLAKVFTRDELLELLAVPT